jgi:response regulator RpfG family c-di-GMP phosphodiesterase
MIKKQSTNKATQSQQPIVRLEKNGTEIGVDNLGFLDAFPFYILLIDQDHCIVWGNSAVSKHLGLDVNRIIGGYCPKVIHGLDKPFPGCPLEEAVVKKQAVTGEFHDPITKKWIEAAIYPTKYCTQNGKTVFLHMIYDISERKNAELEIKHSYDIQNALNKLLNLSLQEISLEELLKHSLDVILAIPWLTLESRGAIFIVEGESETLTMKVQSSLAAPIQKGCAKLPFGKCLCGRAASSREIQFADRLDERHEIRYEGIYPHGHYCVPIVASDRVLGVINTYLKEGHARIKMEEEFLTAAASTLASILLRKEQFEKLQRTLRGIVAVLASAVEKRDAYTAGHQRRVTELSVAIARQMGLSSDQIEAIRMAGTIHDLGKISVPAEILSKPSRLNEAEFSIIKLHPQAGYDILKDIEFPWPIAQIVLQHHERMNGSGYPLGLSGQDILVEARILAVADVVESMASHRPYRSALGLDKALEEISANKDILYDPQVVDACLELFSKEGFKLE